MERRLLTPAPCATSANARATPACSCLTRFTVKRGLCTEARRRQAPPAWARTSAQAVLVRDISSCSTARDAERRGMPDGAECQTARNARRRGMPDGAECRTAPNAERRMIPYGAKTAPTLLRLRGLGTALSRAYPGLGRRSRTEAVAIGSGPSSASSDVPPRRPIAVHAWSGIPRRSAFRAVWHSAPFGIPRRLAVRSLSFPQHLIQSMFVGILAL